MASPIADLSYRHYDGPIDPPTHRWWAIARTTMRMGVKKRFFYLWSSMTAWYYILMLAIFYFVGTLGASAVAPGQKNPFLQQVIWKDQFLHGFGFAQLFYLILSLMLGAGAIANDNRANALLVYLSKPCSRLDYVIGKWLGIFIPLTVVAAVPVAFFYLYCLLTYREYGFLTEDPRLPLKLIALVLVPGAVHASLGLGISSLFSQGRLAGATYAGLYFFTNFFTVMMGGISATQQVQGNHPPAIVGKLFYASIDGIQIGLAKAILGTDGSAPFLAGGGGPRGRAANVLPVAAPEPWLIFGIALFVCVGAMFVAWTRVRAVEVVG